VLAVDDTFSNLAECCGRFLRSIEKMLVDETPPERLMDEMWELQRDLIEALELHSQFIKKIEQIEESQEMSDNRSGWKEFKSLIKELFNKRKETKEMDTKKEQEYQDKITSLDALLKEFQDREAAEVAAKAAAETAAAEATAKAEADAKIAFETAAAETLATEVKQFCETAIKENRMTPAMREVDEKIMLDLAKTAPEALKSFQQKYTVGIVPLGEVKEINTNQTTDVRPGVIGQAEKYVKDHPKEFADITDANDKISRAVYLQAMGKITFKGDK
jgi:hypothetical protein